MTGNLRKFTSYGPIDTKKYYYAPREELITRAYNQLTGENSDETGHYITVWAPRQCGKTWLMQQVGERIRKKNLLEFAFFSMEPMKGQTSTSKVLTKFCKELSRKCERELPVIDSWDELPSLFTRKYFKKPLVLILDEFDCLEEELINQFANLFRSVFIDRLNETNKSSVEKSYLLHGLALIGVRGVLGIENIKGSPFNIQQSLHVPNLTFEEVKEMFQWYSRESGQAVGTDVVKALYDETRGQPGLTCWFGELITEKFNPGIPKPIGNDVFEEAYAAATHTLPNNTILNIISKANKEPHRETVLELFKTDRKIIFNFDDESINYLYMNGVIDEERVGRTGYYVRFSSSFVQKRLFGYFSRVYFKQLGQLVEPFSDLSAIITANRLEVRGLMGLYQGYLDRNRSWLFRDVPRRSDMRVYEALFHFNLYSYLHSFLRDKEASVYPEFPTGNGKIDLLIKHNDRTYGIELKSYTDHTGYRLSLEQAAGYGKQLGLSEIYLVIFVETIDEQNRLTYEKVHRDETTRVEVKPIFITTLESTSGK